MNKESKGMNQVRGADISADFFSGYCNILYLKMTEQILIGCVQSMDELITKILLMIRW